MESLAWVPIAQPPTGHRSPPCLSFSASGLGGQAVWLSVAPWAVRLRKEMLGAAGKGLRPREGGGGWCWGGWRRSVCLCVQPGGLCLWDGQGMDSAIPDEDTEAGFELVSAFLMGRW